MVAKDERKGFAGKLDEFIGFIRTYTIAYCIPGWQSRLTKLYRPFVKEGMLCFDIGSHFGNRIQVWRKLGARVVAVEPQPSLYAFLTSKYQNDSNVSLIQGVLADRVGEVTFYHNTKNPSVSTIDQDWLEEKRTDPMWGKYTWDRQFTVAASTLDMLISTYGIPDFCKIDVEGAELTVLSGLSTPLKCLSFEYLTIDKSRTLSCIDRLEELGSYEYNWTFSEFSRLKSKKWLNADEMKAIVSGMNDGNYSGDIYASLVVDTEPRKNIQS